MHLNLFGTRDWFCGRQYFHRPGLGGMVSGWFKRIMFIEFVEQEAELMWQCKQRGVPVNTGEASFAGLLLASCCMAQFLTGHRLVCVHDLGVGTPALGENQSCSFQLLVAPRVPCLVATSLQFLPLCYWIFSSLCLLYVLIFLDKIFSLFLFIIYVAVSGLSCDIRIFVAAQGLASCGKWAQ